MQEVGDVQVSDVPVSGDEEGGGRCTTGREHLLQHVENNEVIEHEEQEGQETGVGLDGQEGEGLQSLPQREAAGDVETEEGAEEDL